MEPKCIDPLLNPSSTFEPPRPSSPIQSYIGVKLDENYQYLSVCLNNNICFIWSKRPKKCEDASLQNSLQAEIFKKVISLLKGEKPLRNLSEISSDTSCSEEIGICYDSPVDNIESQDIESRAVLIAAVFSERMSLQLNKKAHYETYHRNHFALALKWHIEEYFNDEKKISINSSSPCPSIVENYADLVHSRGGRLTKRSSQSDLRPLLNSFNPQSQDIRKSPRVPILENLNSPKLMFKELGLECLYHCRTYWLGGDHSFSSAAVEAEFLKAKSNGLLNNPLMKLVLEEELSRNIAFSLSTDVLFQDIDRTILHLSVNNSISCSSLPKLNLEGLKKSLLIDSNKFIYHSARFQNLLTNLMIGLNVNELRKKEILAQWNKLVHIEKYEISNESFYFAVQGFFKGLNMNDHDENRLRQLIILLRQRMYMHPMLVIKEVLKDIPLQYEHDHPSREMAYHFLRDSAFEYRMSFFASLSQDENKESKKNKLPPFELEILNTMSSSLDDLSSWSSSFTIKLRLLSTIKRKSSLDELFQTKVCLPLQMLGFRVVIIKD